MVGRLASAERGLADRDVITYDPEGPCSLGSNFGDLLVGLLAEQLDDDGAEVLVARPRSLSGC